MLPRLLPKCTAKKLDNRAFVRHYEKTSKYAILKLVPGRSYCARKEIVHGAETTWELFPHFWCEWKVHRSGPSPHRVRNVTCNMWFGPCFKINTLYPGVGITMIRRSWDPLMVFLHWNGSLVCEVSSLPLWMSSLKSWLTCSTANIWSLLTHWGLNEMATILQKKFSNAIAQKKRLHFAKNSLELFLRVHLVMNKKWSR